MHLVLGNGVRRLHDAALTTARLELAKHNRVLSAEEEAFVQLGIISALIEVRNNGGKLR